MRDFRALKGQLEDIEDEREEGEARIDGTDHVKFSWIYLVNCSTKWTSQTPTGDLAIEKHELSFNDDRGFHADGEHVNPLQHRFLGGGSTDIQLLQVMDKRWVCKNAGPT